MTDPERDAYDEKSILQRLGLDSPWSDRSLSVIGVAHPARQQAVMRLAKQGLVVWSWGEGKDTGIMLVRRPADGKPPRYPGLGGGAVA